MWSNSVAALRPIQAHPHTDFVIQTQGSRPHHLTVQNLLEQQFEVRRSNDDAPFEACKIKSTSESGRVPPQAINTSTATSVNRRSTSRALMTGAAAAVSRFAGPTSATSGVY